MIFLNTILILAFAVATYVAFYGITFGDTSNATPVFFTGLMLLWTVTAYTVLSPNAPTPPLRNLVVLSAFVALLAASFLYFSGKHMQSKHKL
jgi:phosphatidylserine synthase